MSHPYSLNMLPVDGMGLIAQSVDEAQQRLTSTLNIIDGIKACPAGLPGNLSQAVSNIRYHVIVALAFIDAFLRTGHNLMQPMVDVEGLRNAIDLQIAAVNKARPSWDQWYKDAVAQGTPKGTLPAPTPQGAALGFDDYGADAPSTSSIPATPTARDYVFVGLVSGVVWLFWKMLK